VWTCIKDGEYHGPPVLMQVVIGTTVVKGRRFMGVDLATMLDQEAQMQSADAT